MNGKRCRYCEGWCDIMGPRVCSRCSRQLHVVVRATENDPHATVDARLVAPWSPYPVGRRDVFVRLHAFIGEALSQSSTSDMVSRYLVDGTP